MYHMYIAGLHDNYNRVSSGKRVNSGTKNTYWGKTPVCFCTSSTPWYLFVSPTPRHLRCVSRVARHITSRHVTLHDMAWHDRVRFVFFGLSRTCAFKGYQCRGQTGGRRGAGSTRQVHGLGMGHACTSWGGGVLFHARCTESSTIYNNRVHRGTK